jgi:FkbM family methyltransferase
MANAVAIGDTDSSAAIKIFADSPRALLSGSSLVPKGNKEVATLESVETARLDSFIRDYAVTGVDLVKIDVERAEKIVIGGMIDTLQDYRHTC